MSQPHHNKHQSLLSPGGGRGGDGIVNQGRMHVQGMASEMSAGAGHMMRQHNDSLNSSFDSRKPGAYGHESAYGGNSQLRMSGKIA
jgi:hypothetical protein